MFKNIDEFREYNKRLVLFCIFIIYLVLTGAYIIEYRKGNRDLEYVILFCSILWSSFLIDYWVARSKFSKYVSYVMIFGYIVFYSFCMLTTVSNETWIYIFPFAVLIPLLFRSVSLIVFAYSIFLGINVIDLIINFDKYTETSLDIIELEQRFACIILVLAFLVVLTTLLRSYESILTSIYKDASVDQISGLRSNDYIAEKIVPMIERNKNITYTMVLINIDKFFRFNDNYGHAYGDKVLGKVGEIILEEIAPIRANVNACRIYGDKFILIFTNRTYDEVKNYYKAIKDRLNALILRKNEMELTVSTTISVTDTRLCGHTYDEMYKRIRFLQDVARSKGGNNLIEDSIDLL